MLRKHQIASLIMCSLSLTACMSYNPNGYSNYRSYVYQGEPIYPESYDSGANYRSYSGYPEEKKPVVVPESYHVGPYRSPVSHKDQDKTWISGQNPQSYTIEVADADKPSQVSGKLSKVPKNNRQAAIRYERDGKTYYKGVYGTYDNYEAAQQALSALPADVKEGASIKSWSNVQGTLPQ